MLTKALMSRMVGAGNVLLVTSVVLSLSPLQAFGKDRKESDDQQLALPSPFEAEYRLNRRGRTLGEGRRSLRKLPDGTFELLYSTRANFLFLKDKRTEITRFSLVDNHLIPRWYQFSRNGTGKDKRNEIGFNSQSKTVKNLLSDQIFEHIEYDPGLHDALSYQFQLQVDLLNARGPLSYAVVNREGMLKHYEFAIEGEELLQVPHGEINTVRLKRRQTNGKRETVIWLAPELDYTLVRIRQLQKGKENYDILLRQYRKILSPPGELKHGVED